MYYVVSHKLRIFLPSTLDSLFIGGSEVGGMFEIACLLFNFNPRLKFNSHIHDVVKKLSKFVHIIYKITTVSIESFLKMLHYSHPYPIFIYYASAWMVIKNLFKHRVFSSERCDYRIVWG